MKRIKASIKNWVKVFLGFWRCLLSGVQNSGGVYIGRHVHFANAKRIKLGKKVQIRADCDIFADNFIEIGQGSDIGTRNRIAGNVIIGEKVLLGPNSHIASVDHVYTDPDLAIMDQGAYEIKRSGHDNLYIGDGSWIGANVAIIGCVHIGIHCVIGANSVVTKDIPDYCVVVGNPAKRVRFYNKGKMRWEKIDNT